MRTRFIVALALALLVWSCSGDRPASKGTSSIESAMATPEFEEACAELPTCAVQFVPAERPTETIWRVQVVREASGEIRFGRVDPVEVAEGIGVPLGSRTGEYVLVGLDRAGDPVDAQLIQFPTAARIEFTDPQVRQQFIDLSGNEVSSMGYIRGLPSLERFALKDSSGQVVVETQVPSTRAAVDPRNAQPGVGLVSPAWAAGGPGGFSPSCPHVLILDGEADRALLGSTPLGLAIDLQPPGTVALANILAALGRMTPLLCHGVSRIAFGRFSWEGAAGVVAQVGWGDMMMVNLDSGYSEFQLQTPGGKGTYRQMDLQHTIIHEAGHTVEALLNAEGESLVGMGYEGAWTDDARSVARETIQRVRLAKGFSEEWRRMHGSFVSQGWARDHIYLVDTSAGIVEWADDQLGESVDLPEVETPHKNWTDSEVVEAGFISKYAATNSAEDIADSIAWSYMGEAYAIAGVGSGREDLGCTRMQLHTERSVPSRLAAVYTKIQFVKDLGLVGPQEAESCTGTKIGLPITTEGFEVWQGGSLQRSFTSGVEAGIGTKKLTRQRIFRMEAEGTAGFGEGTYPATMTLHLDLESTFDTIEETPWPRGVYKFDSSLFSGNQLMVRLDGAAAGNIDAHKGFALVSEASNDRIAGSVFLTHALRPNTPSPLPVYQSFDPPLVIRFLMVK